ncbi:MAG TPA: hypothetical protein VKB57_19015 [Acidimicrobiales bacterium]|nr:hypothetical protein [Acidimicrobiales bacterium]
MTGVRRMRRAFASLACVVLATAGVALAAEVPASATPAKKAPETLAALWTTVLVTPTAQNPFGTGAPSTACWTLGRTLAPLGPVSVDSCSAGTGSPLFITGSSVECSTFEGNGTTEAELRACAREFDLKTAPSITFDGRPLTVLEVETALMQITLPADNFLGVPAGPGTSVAHGWEAQVNPPPPGTHTVVINAGPSPITTTIVIHSS